MNCTHTACLENTASLRFRRSRESYRHTYKQRSNPRQNLGHGRTNQTSPDPNSKKREEKEKKKREQAKGRNRNHAAIKCLCVYEREHAWNYSVGNRRLVVILESCNTPRGRPCRVTSQCHLQVKAWTSFPRTSSLVDLRKAAYISIAASVSRGVSQWIGR